MSLLSRERRAFLGWPQGTTIPSNGSIPSNSDLVSDPGFDQSMRLSAVWGCVRTIADVVAGMPLKAFDEAPDGSRKRRPLPKVLTHPMGRPLPSQWKYQIMVSLLLRGNAYGYITVLDKYGFPERITMMHPDIITPQVNPETGVLTFHARGQLLDPTRVWHIPAFMIPGWPIGLAPITYAALSIATGKAAEQFAKQFFESGGHPTSVLYSDQQVSGTQATDIKQAFLRATRGREPAVFGSGIKYQAIQVNPNESQFLETQNASGGTICRYYGLPPESQGFGVVGSSSMTYANREQRAQDLFVFCINGWLTRLEEAFSELQPEGQVVTHDTKGLLKADLLTRYRAYSLGIDAGILTPNMALTDEGEDTFPEGDQRVWPPKKAFTGVVDQAATTEDGNGNKNP